MCSAGRMLEGLELLLAPRTKGEFGNSILSCILGAACGGF